MFVPSLVLTLACAPSDGPVDLSGGIQKGPFVLGSSVAVSVLDDSGAPTGDVFNTTTLNDKGEFAVSVSGGPLVDIATSGFHFDEFGGGLSGAPITLRAIGQISGASSTDPDSDDEDTGSGSAAGETTFVNVLTHVAQAKALADIQAGVDPRAAITDAEAAARDALGLFQPAGLRDAGTMSVIGGDDDANAYLLAVSCAISAGSDTDHDAIPEDALIQEALNSTAAAVATGQPVPAAISDRIALGARQMYPLWCMEHLGARLESLGDTSSEVPDIYRAVDFDHDGTADASDDDADGDGVSASDEQVQNAFPTSDMAGLLITDTAGTIWSLGGSVRQGDEFVYQGPGPQPLDVDLAGPVVQFLSHPDMNSQWILDGQGQVWHRDMHEGDLSLQQGLPPIASLHQDNLAVTVDGRIFLLDADNHHELGGVDAVSAVTSVHVSGPNMQGYVMWIDEDGVLWRDHLRYAPLEGHRFVDLYATVPAYGVQTYSPALAVDDTGEVWDITTGQVSTVQRYLTDYYDGPCGEGGVAAWDGSEVRCHLSGELLISPTADFVEPLAMTTFGFDADHSSYGLLVRLASGDAGFISVDDPSVAVPLHIPR